MERPRGAGGALNHRRGAQLGTREEGGPRLPVVDIRDAPRFPWRGAPPTSGDCAGL